jgi:hypothetical protein
MAGSDVFFKDGAAAQWKFWPQPPMDFTDLSFRAHGPVD